MLQMLHACGSIGHYGKNKNFLILYSYDAKYLASFLWKRPAFRGFVTSVPESRRSLSHTIYHSIIVLNSMLSSYRPSIALSTIPMNQVVSVIQSEESLYLGIFRALKESFSEVSARNCRDQLIWFVYRIPRRTVSAIGNHQQSGRSCRLTQRLKVA